jgi:hypothetical protein
MVHTSYSTPHPLFALHGHIFEISGSWIYSSKAHCDLVKKGYSEYRTAHSQQHIPLQWCIFFCICDGGLGTHFSFAVFICNLRGGSFFIGSFLELSLRALLEGWLLVINKDFPLYMNTIQCHWTSPSPRLQPLVRRMFVASLYDGLHQCMDSALLLLSFTDTKSANQQSRFIFLVRLRHVHQVSQKSFFTPSFSCALACHGDSDPPFCMLFFS